AADPEFLGDGLLRETLGVPAPAWRGALAVASGAEQLRLWTAEVWCRLFLESRSVASVEADLWTRGG
ncbi:MAG: hypothetical protein QOJ07_273, partial [Thermoleophilaceae bacterium]|nr:hypothetical protein [Thermoleophilaceae bacterium]